MSTGRFAFRFAIPGLSSRLCAHGRLAGQEHPDIAGKSVFCGTHGRVDAGDPRALKREGIEIGYFCDPLLTALPGGSPLRNDTGTVVGAIGVSGLTSAEDQVVTDAIAEFVLSGSKA